MATFGHDRGTSMLDQAVAPVDRTVADDARAYVVRECPDDFEVILDILGLA